MEPGKPVVFIQGHRGRGMVTQTGERNALFWEERPPASKDPHIILSHRIGSLALKSLSQTSTQYLWNVVLLWNTVHTVQYRKDEPYISRPLAFEKGPLMSALALFIECRLLLLSWKHHNEKLFKENEGFCLLKIIWLWLHAGTSTFSVFDYRSEDRNKVQISANNETLSFLMLCKHISWQSSKPGWV